MVTLRVRCRRTQDNPSALAVLLLLKQTLADINVSASVLLCCGSGCGSWWPLVWLCSMYQLEDCCHVVAGGYRVNWL